MPDNSGGGWFFFCLAEDVVVFFVFFGVPAEQSAFANTPAAFFRPPPFFFIGAEEGGGEKGSLEVFAMTDKSRGNEDGGGLSVGLRRCMCIISKSTEGTCLTNIDKDRGRVGQIKLKWGRNVTVKIGPGCI
jgi:hypothetical protein